MYPAVGNRPRGLGLLTRKNSALTGRLLGQISAYNPLVSRPLCYNPKVSGDLQTLACQSRTPDLWPSVLGLGLRIVP